MKEIISDAAKGKDIELTAKKRYHQLRPYKYEIRREYWNGKVEYDFTDNYTEDNTRLGLVKESVYVDTRFEAKMRLYNYITNKETK